MNLGPEASRALSTSRCLSQASPRQQGDLGDLDLQVNMVGHQTKGVHPEPKSLVRFLEDLVEAVPVLVI